MLWTKEVTSTKLYDYKIRVFSNERNLQELVEVSLIFSSKKRNQVAFRNQGVFLNKNHQTLKTFSYGLLTGSVFSPLVKST